MRMDGVYCDDAGRLGSTHMLNIQDTVTPPQTKTRHPHRKSCFTALTISFFLLTIIFAILFVIFFVKSTDNDTDNQKECTSADCVRTAALILDKIDMEADPCQDFSQFACGRFYRDTLIPDHQQYVDAFSHIRNKNMETVRIMLQSNSQPNEKSYVTKMRQFYKMCLDTDTIESIGLTPYLESDNPKDWPTLNPNWTASTFDLNDVIAKYGSLFTGNDNLFQYTIGPDSLQSSKNILKINQPNLCLTIARMKTSPRNDSAILACQNYYMETALALGADDVIALQDAKDWVDLEIRMANISMLPEESANKTKIYNPMTLEEMANNFPPIDWQRVFQEVFHSAGISLDGNTTVINESPIFFVSLRDVLKNTSNRVIQNMFSFHHAVTLLKGLTPALRDASLGLQKYQPSITQLKPRWRQCVKEVKTVFGAGLSKQFVSRTFSQRSKSYLQQMMANLKTSFRQQIENASWMGQKTKAMAVRKLDALTHKIGFPDKNFGEDYVDNMYSNITITKDRFGQTRTALLRHQAIGNLHKITRKVDNSNWQDLAMEVNAQNVHEANDIRFYAGFLQPNFFSEVFPSSINYGAIGYVMGHELTHFFDNVGSQHDEHGNVKNWWQPHDLQRFRKRLQCLVDQYSAFQVSEISTHLNGKLTVGENTADNGGIKAAFRAYKEFSKTSKRELPLPSLGLTRDQEFFVAFGQAHCSLHTNNDLKTVIEEQMHPPGKYRMLGTLRNSQDFSKAFNCPVGTPMNPVKKCTVW